MAGIAVIDVGSTWTKLYVYRETGDCTIGEPLVSKKHPTPRLPGPPGYSRLNPGELWRLLEGLAREAARAGADRLAVSLHRSSVVAWDREGRPLSPVIVWDDRKVAEQYGSVVPLAARLLSIVSRGLRAVFSPEAALPRMMMLARTLEGRPGRDYYLWTLDSWILYRATRSYLGEASHAAVTGLVHPATLKPIGIVLGLSGLPGEIVPEITDTYGDYGSLAGLGLEVVSSDQQAALVASGAFGRGEYKASMGTGLFVDKYTGASPVMATGRGLIPLLVASIRGRRWYALEGFTASAGVLLDILSSLVSKSIGELEELAGRAEHPLIVIPSLQGLQYPRRRMARGAVLGLTRNTGLPELALGAFTSIALHAAAITAALSRATGEEPRILRIDGGLSKSTLMARLLSLLTGARVEIVGQDAPARGSALLACMGTGFSPEKAQGKTLPEKSSGVEVSAPRRLREEAVEAWLRVVKGFSGDREWRELLGLVRLLAKIMGR